MPAPPVGVIRSIFRGRLLYAVRTHRITWQTNRVVWSTQFGGAHSIAHFWNAASGAFVGYYINLPAPLRRTPLGFDSLDHVLDVVVNPDGTWRWKDEDELEEAVRLGAFTADQATRIRTEGEHVIANLPNLLPTGWEDWLPDPAWSPPTLPEAAAALHAEYTA
jgi:predicted RNA-binding protein associated with RNAse of E/G family